MIIYLIINRDDGSIVTAFISHTTATKFAESDLKFDVKAVHVRDAQSNPVRG